MLSEQAILQRSRLAWFILVFSFSICFISTVSSPFVANWFVQTSTEVLDVLVHSNRGTVRIDNENGGPGALIPGGPGQLIQPGATVVTGNTETAVWVVSEPDSASDEERLIRLQVYSNTTLRLMDAKTPRFAISNKPNVMDLNLEGGRLRLSVPEGERPLTLNLTTPQSVIEILEPGQYSVVVTTDATEMTVEEGRATVAATVEGNIREIMPLNNGTRARVPTGSGPIGREGTDRDLVRNGSFQQGQNNWNFFTWNVDLADQLPGFTALDSPNGESRLFVIRDGIGHADFRIRQTIRQDVTDLEALLLSLTFRINGQSLGVCGVVGSECPLFVRVNYIDEQGASQVWQHGFYAVGEIDPNNTPDACVNCGGFQTPHEKVPLGQDFFYEVDLPTELAQQGAPPIQFIDSIELVTSGHSFNVELYDVSLLAIE